MFTAGPGQSKPARAPVTPKVLLHAGSETLEQHDVPGEPEPAAVVAHMLEDIAVEQKTTIESICRQALVFPALDTLHDFVAL